MIEVRQTEAYVKWFAALRDPMARTQIVRRIERIEAVFEDGDPDEIRRALGHVARAV